MNRFLRAVLLGGLLLAHLPTWGAAEVEDDRAEPSPSRDKVGLMVGRLDNNEAVAATAEEARLGLKPYPRLSQERPFYLYVPRSYVRKQPAPLVIVWHPRGKLRRFSTRTQFDASHLKQYAAETIEPWKAIADKHGIIVMAPLGDPDVLWMGMSWFTGDRGKLIDAQIKAVVATHAIDPARIYLVASGEGAHAAIASAVRHGDTLAAVYACNPPLLQQAQQRGKQTVYPESAEAMVKHAGQRKTPLRILAGDRDTKLGIRRHSLTGQQRDRYQDDSSIPAEVVKRSAKVLSDAGFAVDFATFDANHYTPLPRDHVATAWQWLAVHQVKNCGKGVQGTSRRTTLDGRDGKAKVTAKADDDESDRADASSKPQVPNGTRTDQPKSPSEQIKQLVAELAGDDPAKVHAAYDALLVIGQPAMKPVLKMAKQSRSRDTRMRAYFLLREIAKYAKEDAWPSEIDTKKCPWSKPVAGIAARLSCDRNSYEPGQVVRLTLEFSNVTEGEVKFAPLTRINTPRSSGSGAEGSLEIEKEGGPSHAKPKPYKASEHEMTLKPGQVVRYRFRINEELGGQHQVFLMHEQLTHQRAGLTLPELNTFSLRLPEGKSTVVFRYFASTRGLLQGAKQDLVVSVPVVVEAAADAKGADDADAKTALGPAAVPTGDAFAEPKGGWPAKVETGAINKVAVKGLEQSKIAERAWFHMAVPKDYTAKKAWPLMVVLHGGPGGKPDHIIGYYRGGLTAAGVISVYPNAPAHRLLAWNYPEASAYVLAIIRQVAAEYRIDPKRIYLTGVSMGGGGCWVQGALGREVFAAVGPVSGWFGASSSPSTKLLDEMPLYILHGEKDRAVPASRSHLAVAALKKLGRTVTTLEAIPDDSDSLLKADCVYREVAGAEHNVFNPWKKRGSRELGLMIRWMLRHQRKKPADLDKAIERITVHGRQFGWSPKGSVIGGYQRGTP